jgi:thiol-disulfide isomerase/thioredoxin
MHEVLLYALPAAGGAAYGVRLWWRQRVFRHRLSFGPLEGTDGRPHSLGDFAKSKAIVVIFMTNRCPGVKAYDARLRRLHEKWKGQVAFVGINPASDALYPDESLRHMAEAAAARALPFPYLKDATQETARRFGAVCTPEVFLLDPTGRVRYRGRIDDSIVESGVSRPFLAEAIERLAGGRRDRARSPWTPPLGCTIEFA